MRSFLFNGILIRQALKDDISDIFNQIRSLSQFQGTENYIYADQKRVEQILFGSGDCEHKTKAMVAERDGKIVGNIFYTFVELNMIYCPTPLMSVDSFYLEATERGNGLGTAMLRKVAEIGLGKGCTRVEWLTLNDNETAKEFYKKIGAKPRTDLQIYRLADRDFMNFINSNNDIAV